MNRSEWQCLCKEEAEWALSQVAQLTKAKRIHWKLESFSPAELIHGDTKYRAYIVQRFEASSVWNGSKLSFSSCAMIHIPSGKGDIGISFIYVNGTRSYLSYLSRDNHYEETPAESLLKIYGDNLIVKSCEAIWNAVEIAANMYTVQVDDLFCLRYFSSGIRRNWLVALSKQLISEHKYTDFQRIILDTNYRKWVVGMQRKKD